MAEPVTTLTPPPILNAIADLPSGLTPRVWARWFDLLSQQAGTPGPQGEPGEPGPPGPQGDPGTPGPTNEEIQDLMATTMNDSAHINWTYNDTLNYLSCDLFAGSINTADLTNDGVTYAKIQNVTDNRLLGRSAGSAGDVQELTTGAGLTLAGGVLSATTTYAEGTFTITATGMTTTVTGTASYVRVGKQVTLAIPGLLGTSNATTFTLTGVPVALGTTQSQWAMLPVADNGVPSAGRINAPTTSGVMTVQRELTNGVWTASGSKSTNNVSVSYVIV